MSKRAHFTIAALALAVALPFPPIKGGIPAMVWTFSSLHLLLDPQSFGVTGILMACSVLSVSTVIAVAALLTWGSWTFDMRRAPSVTLAILVAVLTYLMTRPIYDGGGWLDPSPSKTFMQMLRTGV